MGKGKKLIKRKGEKLVNGKWREACRGERARSL